MRQILIVLLSLLFYNLPAQNYLVTTKGDTIKGELKILTYDRLDRVQISVDKKKNQFTALQVKLICLNSEFYKPVQLESSVQFMKILKDGYLSLLAFRMPNQVIYDGRYLLKKDGKGMELPNIGFKKLIISFIDDCPDVVNKVKDEKRKRSDIEKIIDEYNSCIDQKTKLIEEEKAQEKTVSFKNEAIDQLKIKVQQFNAFESKKDVMDLLADISEKISHQQTVPNYQFETLKNLLSGKEEVKAELEHVLSVLK